MTTAPGDIRDERPSDAATLVWFILTMLHALGTPLEDTVADTGKALTMREADVLRLVALGLTNAQVADRLFVSRRTVDHHLASIYSRLGVSSRAAATRLAILNHLC